MMCLNLLLRTNIVGAEKSVGRQYAKNKKKNLKFDTFKDVSNVRCIIADPKTHPNDESTCVCAYALTKEYRHVQKFATAACVGPNCSH